MSMNDEQLKKLGEQMYLAMAATQSIMTKATNDIINGFMPCIMAVQEAQGTTPPIDPPVEPPPIDPPPVEPPPTTGEPPYVEGKTITAPTLTIPPPGQVQQRYYTGQNGIPAFLGRDVLIMPFVAPVAPVEQMTISVTHDAGGSHTREYVLADNPDGYNLLWGPTLGDAASLRLTVGMTGTGRITLVCGKTYYLIANNAPPGVETRDGTFNVVVVMQG